MDAPTNGGVLEVEEGSTDDDPGAHHPSQEDAASVRATVVSSNDVVTGTSPRGAPISATATSPHEGGADGVKPPIHLPSAVATATSSQDEASDAAGQPLSAFGMGDGTKATGPEGRGAKRHCPENFVPAVAGQAEDEPGGL